MRATPSASPEQGCCARAADGEDEAPQADGHTVANDEKSIDNFHAKGDRLYNVYMRTATKDVVNGLYTVPMLFRDKRINVAFEDASEVIPEIESMAFYHAGYAKPWGKPETFRVGDKSYKLEGSRASKEFFHDVQLSPDRRRCFNGT